MSIGIIWLLFSDRLLTIFVGNSENLAQALIIKSWLFILATGLLLIKLIRYYVSALRRSEDARNQAEDDARHLADYDLITDLPNPSLFKDILGEELSKAQSKPGALSVLSIHIDRFKEIGDAIGSSASDQVLTTVAERIALSLREADSCARIGDHEFNVILPKIKDEDGAAFTARRLMTQISKPLEIGINELHLTACIGISLFPKDGVERDTLVSNAHTAMHLAKRRARNEYAFYSREQSAQAVKNLTLEHSLRRAIEKNQLVSYYQPCVDISTKRIVSAEALLRWEHPEKGLIFPGDFISLAEDNGLIVDIGNFMLESSCNQNKLWQAKGLSPLSISVNISARQFEQKGLVETIEAATARTCLEPRFLEVEITESTIMNDSQSAQKVLGQLKSMGVRILIDDFGTGYSAIDTLTSFPIDVIKIDRSFIKNLSTDPHCPVIVRAIISMAHILEMTVTAEGVETLDQLEILRSLNCDAIQGYYFSPPVPAQDFVQLRRDYPER